MKNRQYIASGLLSALVIGTASVGGVGVARADTAVSKTSKPNETVPRKKGVSMQNIEIYKKAGVYACFPYLTQTADGVLYTTFYTRARNGNNPHTDATGGTASYVSLDDGLTWQPTTHDPGHDLIAKRKDGGQASIAFDAWVEFPAAEHDSYVDKGYTVLNVRPGIAAYLGGIKQVNRKVSGEETIKPVPGTEDASVMSYLTQIRTRSGVRLVPVYGSMRRANKAKGIPGEEGKSYVARSEDDGSTWKLYPVAAPIAGPDGAKISFNETAIAELPNGKIIALMRTSSSASGYLFQCDSEDAGKTWTAPKQTPIWGYPAHILVLKNGDVLASYGYRRAPMGVRACVSHDNGKTWDIKNEVTLRSDGVGYGADLGYPQTVQNADGSLTSVYYMTNADKITHVAATRWQIPTETNSKTVPMTSEKSGKSEKSETNTVPPLAISRGSSDAGTYQAFPDMCRLKNGDIAAVFYAGYQHVSVPTPDWPKGGRICMVRSKDEGKTWSKPRTIYDDSEDNRDPHIAQLPDGRLALTMFSLKHKEGTTNGFQGSGVEILYSKDGGETWDSSPQTLTDSSDNWYCSAPVRVLPSGTWMLGVYRGGTPTSHAHGGVLRSTDQGKTWGKPISIDENYPVSLDAETDVIALKDGSIFAALRSSKVGEGMRYSTSKDDGKTWSPVLDAGFHGESPYLYRLKDGTILLGVRRRPDTVLYVSQNDTLSWKGPYQIDNVVGAYPSIVELKDGTALIVYYSEGKESEVRVRRFRIEKDGITALPL